MKPLFLLVLLSFSFISCSRISIATRYADTFIWWEVNRLVDFSSDKRKVAKAEVEKMYRLIVTRSFPVLADTLSQLPDQINSGRSVDKLPCFESFTKTLIALPEELRPSAEYMTSLLGSTEYQNLVINYREKIDLEEQKIQKQRKEQSILYQDFLEYLVGDLTSEQESMIKDFYALESYPFDLQNKNKKHYLQLLESTKGDSEKLRLLAKDFFVMDSSLELTEFKKARQDFFNKLMLLTTKILTSLSENQKKEFKNNSIEFSSELKRIVEVNT
ncbi:MAG: hypothetical protein ACXVCP_07850 [Bdellovibrio sp.]